MLQLRALGVVAVCAIGACSSPAPAPPKAEPPPYALSHAQIVAKAHARGPRDCAKDVRYMSAIDSLAIADAQIKKLDYRRANIALRDGLEGLGEVFDGDDVNDDSGQRLQIAGNEEWNGHLTAAAIVRRTTLTERLADYAEIEYLTGCPPFAQTPEPPFPPSGSR